MKLNTYLWCLGLQFLNHFLHAVYGVMRSDGPDITKLSFFLSFTAMLMLTVFSYPMQTSKILRGISRILLPGLFANYYRVSFT
jgi:hypothetical protein